VDVERDDVGLEDMEPGERLGAVTRDLDLEIAFGEKDAG
jgi:hypothetical protein